MRQRLSIFFISLLLSLPFWWGINSTVQGLGKVFLGQQAAVIDARLFTAQASQQILGEEKSASPTPQVLQLQELKIAAHSVLAVDFDARGNEQVRFEKNSQDPVPIASLTKLMTAFVIYDLKETYRPNDIVLISQQAASQEGESRFNGLKAGEKFSVDQLLGMMLIASSNDAAYALSSVIGQEGFVGMMNLYAKELGMSNTYFVNATGLEPDNLSEPHNYSTAQDLVRLAAAIEKKHPQIFEITAQKSDEVLNPDGTLHHFIPENTNKLLGEIPEIIGGKTGFTPGAGECLLVVLKKPGQAGYSIDVILGSKDRFGEMHQLIGALGQL